MSFMKATILALIGLGLYIQAHSEAISTVDGATYNNVTTKRVDPDGLYIEYGLPGGGVGMSKVKFSRLSPDQQKQFGYNADMAKDFEAKVSKATDDLRQQSIRWDEAAKAEKKVRQAQETEKVANGPINATAQANQAQSSVGDSPGVYTGYEYGWSSWSGYPESIRAKKGLRHHAKTHGALPPRHTTASGAGTVHK